MAAKGAASSRIQSPTSRPDAYADIRDEIKEILAVAKEVRDIQAQVLETLKLVDLQVPALQAAAKARKSTDPLADIPLPSSSRFQMNTPINLGKSQGKPMPPAPRLSPPRRKLGKMVLDILMPW